jgi:hypothetical protein
MGLNIRKLQWFFAKATSSRRSLLMNALLPLDGLRKLHSFSSALCPYPNTNGLCVCKISSKSIRTVSHGSFGQTEKFDQTIEAFIKDAKIPALVNRVRFIPCREKLDRLYLRLKNYEYTGPK